MFEGRTSMAPDRGNDGFFFMKFWVCSEMGYFHYWTKQKYWRKQEVKQEVKQKVVMEYSHRGMAHMPLVRDQGDLDKCQPIQLVQGLETFLRWQGGINEPLSIQQAIDCGAKDDKIYKWLRKNGLTTERSYPFTGTLDSCKCTEGMEVYNAARMKLFTVEGSDDIKKIKKQIRDRVPVYASIEARSDFVNYDGSGIYLGNGKVMYFKPSDSDEDSDRLFDVPEDDSDEYSDLMSYVPVEDSDADVPEAVSDYMSDVPYYPGQPEAAHSVLLTGCGRVGRIRFFEFMNCWGPEWGDGGYGKVA